VTSPSFSERPVNVPIVGGGVAALEAALALRELGSDRSPVIRGILLTSGKPRYLSANVIGGHGSSSEIIEAPSWSPASKIAARYLARCLDQHDRLVRSSA
jgi:pyruvate/2-oxoglutarate dehydrogenase complex dihydrolipoamide dehydrogenase (E3) component